jgi:hypothetical protein
MNTKATWITDLEKREQELILLRKEQIAREGAVYQREELLKLNEEALKQGYESLERQKKLNKDHFNATLVETEALGVLKGRAEERAKTEAVQKELDKQKDQEITVLKDLLTKTLAALQVVVKVERS